MHLNYAAAPTMARALQWLITHDDTEEAGMVDLQFPHCDARVLHAPGVCHYCDEYPEWQVLRQAWGIAFTGQPVGDGRMPCPSDARRGTGGAHVWPGNTPR